MRRGIMTVPARLILAAALAVTGSLTIATHTVLAFPASTSLTLVSSPGDYIGQGLTEGFDAPGATFTPGGYAQVGATAGSLWIDVTTSTENWEVMFMPPAGQQLQPGTYTNALRAPFNGSSPGLSVTGDGRGCNNDYGSFTIYQLAFASNGSLTQLDADFVQTCESTTAPALQGTVRYQASSRSGVALSSSVALSYPGEPVTLTGTAAPLSAGTPTGTMTFYDGSTPIGTATLDANGRASVTTEFTAVGTHELTAVYSGDATHISGPSVPQAEIVEGGGGSTTWYSYSSVAGDYVGQGATGSYGRAEGTFTLSGTTTTASFTARSGAELWSVELAVPSGSLRSGSFGGGGFANGLVQVSGDGRGTDNYGSFTIAAIGWDSSGNLDMLDAGFIASGFASGQDPMVGVIKYQAPLPATSTSLTAAPATVHPGQATTLTATISSAAAPAPTGSVTFTAGSVVLGTASLNAAGQATLTASFPTLGNPTVVATYGGDPAHAGSASAPVTVTVQNPTVTTLSASPLQPKRGKPLTLTARVTSQDGGTPTGLVTFVDNGKALGSVALDATGTASLVTNLSSGNHSITAHYGGDATDQSSTSNAILVTPH